MGEGKYLIIYIMMSTRSMGEGIYLIIYIMMSTRSMGEGIYILNGLKNLIMFFKILFKKFRL